MKKPIDSDTIAAYASDGVRVNINDTCDKIVEYLDGVRKLDSVSIEGLEQDIKMLEAYAHDIKNQLAFLTGPIIEVKEFILATKQNENVIVTSSHKKNPEKDYPPTIPFLLKTSCLSS